MKHIYGSIQVVLHLSLAIHWLNHIWLLNHCLAGIKTRSKANKVTYPHRKSTNVDQKWQVEKEMQYTFWTWTHKIQFAGQIFVSSQGGRQFLKFVKEDPHLLDDMKKTDPKGLRIFEIPWEKLPNTLDANFCRELGEPANLELKPAPASWSTSYLHEWMKFMVHVGKQLLHTSGLIKWNHYTQLHFDLKTLLKRNRSGSIWENCHVEMYISCELPINLTEKVWMYTPPPKKNWRIDTTHDLRNI